MFMDRIFIVRTTGAKGELGLRLDEPRLGENAKDVLPMADYSHLYTDVVKSAPNTANEKVFNSNY